MPLSISANGPQIVAAYKEHLGREPQPQEVSNWVQHVNNHGGSIESINQGLANHPLAKQKKNIEPIQNAYSDYLGRKAEAGELAGWTDHASRNGLSTEDIIRDIALNPAADDYRQGLRDTNEQLTTDNTRLTGERDTAIDERDIAYGERDTAYGERDTARDERDLYLGQRDTAIGQRDYYVAESGRNYDLYQDALDSSQDLQGQLEDRDQRLYNYEQRDADAQLSGLRGGRSSGGSNQSTRYTGGSLASGGGIRSSARPSARSEGTRINPVNDSSSQGGYSVDRSISAESGSMANTSPVVARMRSRNYQSAGTSSRSLASGSGGSGYYSRRFR